MLGHSSPTTTNRYAHLADDPLRVAANIAGQFISGAKNSGGKVVPIREAE
jgi:hypothetical protein